MVGHGLLFRNFLLFFKSYYGAKKNETHVSYCMYVTPNSSSQPVPDGPVAQTYHIDAVVAGVEREQVAPDQLGLLIEPVRVEHVSLLSHLLHVCICLPR